MDPQNIKCCFLLTPEELENVEFELMELEAVIKKIAIKIYGTDLLDNGQAMRMNDIVITTLVNAIGEHALHTKPEQLDHTILCNQLRTARSNMNQKKTNKMIEKMKEWIKDLKKVNSSLERSLNILWGNNDELMVEKECKELYEACENKTNEYSMKWGV